MKYCLTIVFLIAAFFAGAQMRVSLGTDFVVQRNISSDQQYTAIGQNIRAEWKGNFRAPLYAAFSYYNRGNFSNQLEANAKDPLTIPQTIDYTNKARMRFSHISLGIKPYLKGAWDAEEGWNLYLITGLGIIMGRVENTHSIKIDSSTYQLPVQSGTSRFKRLSLDVGVGFEMPAGGDLFLFTEGKSFIPLTYYPNQFLLNSKYSPLSINLSAGVRILF